LSELVIFNTAERTICLDFKELQVLKDPRDFLDHKVHWVQPVLPDIRVLQAKLEHKAQPVILEYRVLLDLLGLVSLDILESQDLKASQVILDYKDPQVLRQTLEQRDRREFRACKGKMDQRVLKVTKVLKAE
jgi:hypothetical protein